MKIIITCKLPKRMTNFLAWLGLKKTNKATLFCCLASSVFNYLFIGGNTKQNDYMLFLMILKRKDFFLNIL